MTTNRYVGAWPMLAYRRQADPHHRRPQGAEERKRRGSPSQPAHQLFHGAYTTLLAVAPSC